MPEFIELISTLISSGAGIVAILVGVRALRKGKPPDDDEDNEDESPDDDEDDKA